MFGKRNWSQEKINKYLDSEKGSVHYGERGLKPLSDDGRKIKQKERG